MGMEVNAYQAAARGASSRSSSQFEKQLMSNIVSIQDASDALEKFMLDAARDKLDLSEGDSRDIILSKLSDLLWYISLTSWELGVTLESVAIKSLKNRGGSSA
jgi:hypothetical protein